MHLAIDPADDTRVLIPVVGLPFADYEQVRERIEVGSHLMLKPVDDNPHDPKAVEVHFSDDKGGARVGFVPRDAAPGLRLALGVQAVIAEEVPVGRDGDRLAMSFDANTIIGFIELTSAAAERAAVSEAPPGPGDDDWLFRAHMPGEKSDPSAPEGEFELMEALIERLRQKEPDNPVLREAVEGILEDGKWAADDHLFDVAHALEDRLTGAPDTAFNDACARDKVGGLPYCEEGWPWPRCPTCGQEMVFLGQSRDPANPDDLVQAFWCVDTIEGECDEGASLHEANSTVRIWRDPAAASPRTIRPDDEDLILPGHRLEAQGKGPHGVRMRRDGIAHTHFNQCSYEEGRHRVFEISLGDELLDGEGPECYCVVRHGRGLITGWEDWGG